MAPSRHSSCAPTLTTSPGLAVVGCCRPRLLPSPDNEYQGSTTRSCRLTCGAAALLSGSLPFSQSAQVGLHRSVTSITYSALAAVGPTSSAPLQLLLLLLLLSAACAAAAAVLRCWALSASIILYKMQVRHQLAIDKVSAA